MESVAPSLLSKLGPDGRKSLSLLLNNSAYARLSGNVAGSILKELSRRPDDLPLLLDWLSTTQLSQVSENEAGEILRLFVSATAGAVARTGIASRLSQRQNVNTEPKRVTVLFPGQRASTGRGELAETLKVAKQARRLFPDAQVDVVLFDPPERVRYEATTASQAPYRAVDYIGKMLPQLEGWDYSKQPVFEVDGMRIIYGTAHAKDAGSEAYKLSLEKNDFHDGRVGRLKFAKESLGYKSIAAADIAIVAGAPDVHDNRALRLDLPDSPRSRVAFHIFEADALDFDLDPADTDRLKTLRTSVNGADSDTISVHDGAHIAEMRRRVAAYRLPESGSPQLSEALGKRGQLLERIGFAATDANRFATMPWSTSYAHVMGDGDLARLGGWAHALAASTGARGGNGPARSFVAFVFLPKGEGGVTQKMAYNMTLEGAFGIIEALPTVPGQPARMKVGNVGGEIVFLPLQEQSLYRSVLAGSSLVNHTTGANSILDASAAGLPFVYETLGVNGGKLYAVIDALPEAMGAAGFPEEDIRKAVSAFELLASEEGTSSKRGLPPVIDAMEILFADPKKAATIFGALGEHMAVDGDPAMRAVLAEALRANPASGALAAALLEGDTEALLADPKFSNWLESTMPAERLSLLRAALAQGAAGLGVALFSAFTAKAAVDASDLSGSTAVAVEMSAFLAMQISAELAIARHAVSSGVAGGVGVKPGTLLVAGLRGFPRQALLGGVTAATLVEMGVDPETYLFHGGVITGALVPDMAMAAAASALSSTAPRAAGALRWGGRALGVAGVVMLADWVAGAVWRAVDDDAEFEQALGMIAGRLAAEESGMSAVATGVELLLPTTASLAGGHWTDDRWQLQAADLMRAAAADAEVQLLSMIIGGAGTTGQPRNGESNSRHATAKMLNEAPAQDLLKTIALAAGRNRLGGASDFLGVLGEDQKATSAGVNAWMQSSLADMGARVFRTARREHALALFEHAILTKIESEGIAPAFAEVMAELADPSSGAGDILAYMGMAPAELTPLLHALLTESDVPEALQAAKGRAQRALQVMAVASRAHEIAFDVIPANAGIQENPI